ncbi:helix-turn-helix domain-containing protein [Streptococcus cameli]
MDNKEFGAKVRSLRESKKITREEMCGDETELSVRQLARIEAGQSAPTLGKVTFIANYLDVSVGYLTDGENINLPHRYKDLKYKILRIPTYKDEERIHKREAFFDEIFEDYYDSLPEEEQLLIDSMQAVLDVSVSLNVDFGAGILSDYFDQVKKKKVYSLNDYVFIDLYTTCSLVSYFDKDYYDEEWVLDMFENLFQQRNHLSPKESFVLINCLIACASIFCYKKEFSHVQRGNEYLRLIMEETQDFQRMPILCMLEWKCHLYLDRNRELAEEKYNFAVMGAKFAKDSYLEERLVAEWAIDTR